MSSTIKDLDNYPEINFIDNLTVETLMDEMVADFCTKYAEESGTELTLGKADPYRMILYAAALQIYQGMQYIDRAGKQSFLKYAYADFLDNLGALKGVERKSGEGSTAIERFSVSEKRSEAIAIPMGTGVTAGDNVFFYTTEDAEIPAGAEYVDVQIKCADTGTATNAYVAGDINKLMAPIAYIGSVANISKAEGGTDAESDEELADRIYLAPSDYSVAGPEDAYVAKVKKCSESITDVKVDSPSAGVVDIRFITSDGIPGAALIADVLKNVSAKTERPLTDKVNVDAPETAEFEIELTYYVAESEKNKAAAVKKNVEDAIEAYRMWQTERIGRDINPEKLISKLIDAGVKRTEIKKPVFTIVANNQVAALTGTPVVIYGGVESD